MKKKVIVIAYKIEADKGSEDGSGYHLVKALLQENLAVTLISRPNNIERLRDDPNFTDVTLVPVDVLKAIGWFKKGGRGITLYYYLWQIAVGLKLRAMQKTQDYDVLHHLNFHTTWAPHFMFSKKARIVWGPLTRHVDVPRELWHGSSFSYYTGEKFKNILKALQHRLDPFLHWAVKRSDAILYSAPQHHRPYTDVTRLSYAGSVFPILPYKNTTGKFTILFVGRFVNLKGVMIAMRSLDKFLRRLPAPQCRYVHVTIIGEGELYADVMAQAQLIISATGAEIEVLPWQDQGDLADFYAHSALFFYPSMEGQGLVVAEALAHGCPVLGFESTGPHRVAGDAMHRIPLENDLTAVTDGFAAYLERFFKEFTTNPTEYQKHIDQAFDRARELAWSKTAETILATYHG